MAQFQDEFLEDQKDVLRNNHLDAEWITEESVDDELVKFATFPIANEGIWSDEYDGGDDDEEEDDDAEDDDDEDDLWDDDDDDDFLDDDKDDDLLSVDDSLDDESNQYAHHWWI